MIFNAAVGNKIGKCPNMPAIKHDMEQMARLETGVIRNGDDWPGIFIRGDDRDLRNVLWAAKGLLSGEITSKTDKLYPNLTKKVVAGLQKQIEFLDRCAVEQATRGADRDDIQVVELK